MDESNSQEWKEFCQLEKRILGGNETDINTIRDCFYWLLFEIIAQQIKVPINDRFNQDQVDLGLWIGNIYAWNLIARAERILQSLERLNVDPQIYALDQGYYYFVSGQKKKAAKTLLETRYDKKKLPPWFFILLDHIFFLTGRYRERILLLQSSLNHPKSATFKNAFEEKNISQRRFDKLIKGFPVRPNSKPEINSEQMEGFDFSNELLDAWSDLGEYAWALGYKNDIDSDQNNLLARRHHKESRLLTALVHYQQYFDNNPKDLETQFLIGSVHRLLENTKEAWQFFKPVEQEKEYSGLILIFKAEIAYLQHSFNTCEEYLLSASKEKNQWFVSNIASLYLGYIREAKSDYRSALAYYESIKDENFTKLAETASFLITNRIT